MKKGLLIILSLLLLSAASAHAQQVLPISIPRIEITSSPNAVGSGARAQGMGGAFIAIADDATAASWNPGGLMQLERPEFSFVVNLSHRRKDYHFSSHPETSGTQEIYREDLNYFSIAYPFRAFDKNMVVSLNYQRLYDFYDDMQFDQTFNSVSPGLFAHIETHTDFRQTGGLKAFAPAFAIQLTPRFSVGATFNFWTDNLGYDNEWTNQRDIKADVSARLSTTGQVIKARARLVEYEKNDNFEGFNMNLGFLWQISSKITLGAVVKTPFTANVDRHTRTYSYTALDRQAPLAPVVTRTRESIEMHFPLSWGLGLAVRFSDRLTVACDVYKTNWSDFWVRSNRIRTSPITNGKRSDAHIHDTTQLRIGGEYLFILEKTIIPLRMGLFYDPEPSRKNNDDYLGASIGTGVMLGDVLIDMCYIYRFGRSVKGDSVEEPGVDVDVDQHNLLISMIYHF